jgi:hypothetical protein
MRGRMVLLALATVLPTGCSAGKREPVVYEKLSVPFDGLRAHDDPATPYKDLVERLKRRAAAEARDDDRFAPVVSTPILGLRGERMLVAAITPDKGVFYYTDYGPYPLEGPTIIRPRGEIEVCRFAVGWDRLPGGAYVPGLVWASAVVPFPDFDCTRSGDPKRPSGVAEWRRVSEGASYSVVASGGEAGLTAAIVREAWPGRLHGPPNPFDGGRAVAAVAGKEDRIVRAIPLSEDQDFHVETASGRTFVGIVDRRGNATDARCIVEGLRWSDLASSDARRRAAATPLCQRLFAQYAEASRPKPRGPPPRVIETR